MAALVPIYTVVRFWRVQTFSGARVQGADDSYSWLIFKIWVLLNLKNTVFKLLDQIVSLSLYLIIWVKL